MRQAVFEYIEVDYNLTHRHSAIWILESYAILATECRLTRCTVFTKEIN